VKLWQQQIHMLYAFAARDARLTYLAIAQAWQPLQLVVYIFSGGVGRELMDNRFWRIALKLRQ